jgi:alpha-ketoglutarate-dependent taurine dioxygenase
LIDLRAFSAEELSPETAVLDAPLVCEPSAALPGARDLPALMRAHAATVVRTLERHGAILFRGFSVGGAAGFEAALTGLGLTLDDRYEGGASPRGKVHGAVFTSTEVAAPFIIGYHTEQSYQPRRPTALAFYCETAPARYGETPIFDCARVYEEIPRELAEKLDLVGLAYRRFMRERRSILAHRKTWRAAYGTDDRARVEERLRAEGTSYEWTREGLAAEVRVPAVVVDPSSGRRCLNASIYDVWNYLFALRRFGHRYGAPLRFALERFTRYEFSQPRAFLRTVFGDGTPLSREESEAIARAAWRNAIIFPWVREDVLILDNIRFAHARLNVVRPRRILAALAMPYDVRDRRAAAPP